MSRSGVPLTAALATLIGCGEINRPTFPGGAAADDTLPPEIQFALPLPGDTVVAGGSTVPVRVEAHDPSGLTVDLEVTGAVAFAVPPETPPDTLIDIAFQLPIGAGKSGKVAVTANATDDRGNASTKTFTFVVK